jgi:hypothetical protein
MTDGGLEMHRGFGIWNVVILSCSNVSASLCCAFVHCVTFFSPLLGLIVLVDLPEQTTESLNGSCEKI